MTLIDKLTFESRGAHGCSDSIYAFGMTTCCERVGVIDDELSDFYWDAESPSRSISLFEDPACPFCEATAWGLRRIEQLDQVPELWRWALGSARRAGSRSVRPLPDYVRELTAWCRRNAPLPSFDQTLFLDTADPRVQQTSAGWRIQRDAMFSVAEFAPRFDQLLVSGYESLRLSALGIFENALVIGVVRPPLATGVSVGLTVVNYSGPNSHGGDASRWGEHFELVHDASKMNVFEGACHCGNLSYVLESSANDLALRACDCSFCRKHSAVGAAPPDGRLRIAVASADRLQRYRFGTRTADALLCRECGVSIGVIAEIEGRLYAVVNARSLKDFSAPPFLPRLNLGDETLQQRTDRRRARWIKDVEIRVSEPVHSET